MSQPKPKFSIKNIGITLIIIVVIASLGVSFLIFTQKTSRPPVSSIVQDRIPIAPTLDQLPPTSDTGIINLTWQAEPCLSFKIYRNGNIIAIQAGIIKTYTDRVLNDSTYYYGVKATNAKGDSEISNEISISVTILKFSIDPTIDIPVIDPLIPKKPTLNELPFTIEDATITIIWQGLEEESTIKIYRSETIFKDASLAILLTTLGPGYYNYTDVSLMKDGNYYYAVAGSNSHGDGPISNIVHTYLMIPINPGPGIIKAPILESINQISFESAPFGVWLKFQYSLNASSYLIYRSREEIDPTTGYPSNAQCVGLTAANEFIDYVDSTGTYYYYVIIATDSPEWRGVYEAYRATLSHPSNVLFLNVGRDKPVSSFSVDWWKAVCIEGPSPHPIEIAPTKFSLSDFQALYNEGYNQWSFFIEDRGTGLVDINGRVYNLKLIVGSTGVIVTAVPSIQASTVMKTAITVSADLKWGLLFYTEPGIWYLIEAVA